MKQKTLFPLPNNHGLFTPQKGKRKTSRPLSTRHGIHLILKSQGQNLRHRERDIVQKWQLLAQRFGLKTYEIVVCSDHIHSVIKIHSRQLYRKFITALTGWLARVFQIKWKTSPATRIVAWGRDFKRVLKYLKLNEWEALGFLEYQPHRTRRLPDWLRL